MMNAVRAIEDANKEIHRGGELSNILPVGTLANTELSTMQTSALQMSHSLIQHQAHQHHHHPLQTSQSSHHHQQGSQQQNHQKSVGSQPLHEAISPHQQVSLSPHHPSQPGCLSPHRIHQHTSSQQLQRQSLSTPHSLDSQDLQLTLPSQTSSTTTTSSSSLLLHSQGVNTAESSADVASSSQRAHLCTTCLKGFRSKQQLAQHSLVHTNIRKYSCSYCDHTFKQLSHLQQHTRIHTGDKPYSCKFEDCDRAFAQLSNLQHHMRNHEEQVKKDALRIHRCLICHRSYTNDSSLKAHTLKMHIHIKNPSDQNPDDQPVKKRRKKKNKQLYDAPTMVPLGDGQNTEKKGSTESSSDDDVIVVGDRKRHIPSAFANIPRNLVESLNHYESTIVAGISGKKVQDGNISSSNQSGTQQTRSEDSELREEEVGRPGMSFGLQGLMGLPGIDANLMSGQPPEVIERAAAAAAAAVSSQLLQNSHSSNSLNNTNTSLNSFQPHPQPAHSHLVDAHLRSQVAPISLPSVHDPYYTHSMLTSHARFLGPPRTMADLPLPYGSHVSTASSTATNSNLTVPSVHHTGSRPSSLGSPDHVSEALNFNQ